MEWVEAARFHGYRTMDFLSLPVEDKVLLIAAARVKNKIEAVIAQDRKENPDRYK